MVIDFDDYDPCGDCKAYGDDYYMDENGEMACACDDCWVMRLDER